tara:strand:- start:5374 stop:7032 length:1659 start_codon:yes stop_codon:yes gene_type:complete
LEKPVTHYAKSGAINVAYQTFGSGPIDLVYIPGWISNIDLMWACPELANFLNELGKLARVILFDKRGTGLSDRFIGFPILEERMDDIRAVMDEVGSEKAILFGHSEGGSVSALFAATYPNRTIALITFGIFAKRIYSDDYPWAPTNEERQKVYDVIEKNWGGGEMNLESLAPSKANDKVFMDWLATYFRSGASPNAALLITKMNTQVDIIDILSSIQVPTLIMQRTGDIDVKIEEGRFIADRIPGAIFEEFDGDDHLFWTGNTQVVLNTMKEFINELNPSITHEKQLLTILVGTSNQPFVGDAELDSIEKVIKRFRGNLLHQADKQFVASFEGPTKAANCGVALREKNEGLTVGVHIKECLINQLLDEDLKHFISLLKQPNLMHKVLVTQVAKNLLVGSNLKFKTSAIYLKTLEGDSLNFFEASNSNNTFLANKQLALTTKQENDELLNRILDIINSKIRAENFGVKMLIEELSISERKLQRKLKESLNITPSHLIIRTRLCIAKQMLLNENLTISEVAFESGFSNPSYFTKMFKQEFGINPTAFKLQNTID